MSSWLSRALGTNTPTMEYFDPNDVRASYLQGQQPYMTQMGDLSRKYGDRADAQFDFQKGAYDQAGHMLDQSKDLMSGKSMILARMRQQQATRLGDIGQQQTMGQQRALAARGYGGGGLSNILGSKMGSAMGEQERQGLLGIQQYGLEAGKGYGQLGQGLYGSAANFGTLGFQGLSGEQSAAGDVASLQHQANTAATQQQAANINQRNQEALAKQARRKAMWGGIAKGALSLFNPASLLGNIGGVGAATGAAGGYAFNQGTNAITNSPTLGFGTSGGMNFGNLLQGQGLGVGTSDIRVKDNIEYLYNSSDGHKVYAFNYKGGDIRYKGVMAQDILKTNPEVVSKRNGILNVDYSKIDVNMEVL